MRTMLFLGCGLLAAGPVAAGPVAAGPVAAGPAAAPAMPAGKAMLLYGRGVQIYACAKGDAGFAWRLRAPDADLLDAHGKVAGHHFAGPSWRAADGSTVVGEKVAESASPAAGAVPWLVLRAKSHAGSGVFSGVSYIVRSQTEGGAAPAAGCDAAHQGAESRVPYGASYLFFPA